MYLQSSIIPIYRDLFSRFLLLNYWNVDIGNAFTDIANVGTGE